MVVKNGANLAPSSAREARLPDQLFCKICVRSTVAWQRARFNVESPHPPLPYLYPIYACVHTYSSLMRWVMDATRCHRSKSLSLAGCCRMLPTATLQKLGCLHRQWKVISPAERQSSLVRAFCNGRRYFQRNVNLVFQAGSAINSSRSFFASFEKNQIARSTNQTNVGLD